jgi:hypothetical protein
MTVRAFVGSFRGLSGTAKIKAVCDQFPTVERLSDIERTPNVVPALLRAMQEHSRPAAPSVLGAIGKEHLRARFDDWYGIVADRFWYSAQEGTAGGIPFVVECAAAETRQPGASFYGINFSPTYDDPLATVPLTVPSFGSRRYGLKGLLKAAHALPDDVGDGDSTHTATVVHLVCPALDFLDRAKTRLSVSDEFAEPIARVVWGACKTLYKDGERRRKDAARAARVQQAWETQSSATCTLKEAVFAVLQASVDHVTGGKVGDPLQVRSLYYVVRKRIQAFTSKDLDFNYFSQDLLVQYQEAHGAIPGLEYDPRGVLYEPHTGRRVLLGTREVASYQFPAWLYNKILYIEKKGLGGVLLVAGLGERYDMAIIAAEGFATEAARKLCQRADRDQCYEIYVVHDADPAGYNIARTLAEETRRVKDNRVTVIDLGLRYDEALAMGLETETFTRKKALPSGLVLTESERRAFTGRQTGPNSWECTRVELNAMTNPQLLAFVERRLAEVGAVGKVIPPPDALARLSAEHYGERAAAVVAERLWCLYGGDRLTDGVTRLLRDALPPDVIERAIRDGFAADAAQPWRAPMERAVKQNMESQAATIDALARNAEPVPAIEQPDCASQGEPDGRALGALARGADGNAPRPRQ